MTIRGAIYFVHGRPEAEVIDRIRRVARGRAVMPQWFCAWGRSHVPSSSFDAPAHHLVPPEDCDHAFILKGSIPLPRSSAFAVFLRVLATRPGMERVCVEVSSFWRPGRGWINADDLRDLLPDCAIEPMDERGWVSVRCGGVSGTDAPSIYPALAATWVSWDEQLSRAAGEFWLRQLQRALADRGVLERAGLIGSGTGSLLDVGGSTGLFAAELACLGWDATVLDPTDHPARTLPLFQALPVMTGTLRCVRGRMEETAFDEGQFVMISFMGSLLLAQRAEVPAVLAKAMRGLRPGGHLVIREHLMHAGTPTSNDLDRRFRPAELRALVQAAGASCFFDHHGHGLAPGALDDCWVVYGVVRRES